MDGRGVFYDGRRPRASVGCFPEVGRYTYRTLRREGVEEAILSAAAGEMV